MKGFKKFYFWGLFLLVLLSFNSIYASTNYVFFSVNGDTTLKTTAVQGDTMSWGANCAVGAQLYWQIWIDLDSNGVPDAGDKLLFELKQIEAEKTKVNVFGVPNLFRIKVKKGEVLVDIDKLLLQLKTILPQ